MIRSSIHFIGQLQVTGFHHDSFLKEIGLSEGKLDSLLQKSDFFHQAANSSGYCERMKLCPRGVGIHRVCQLCLTRDPLSFMTITVPSLFLNIGSKKIFLLTG
jgi:hypothetical protein